ncbi:hypothetical protein K469DRAFT_677524 [Zopfia rhizophila CBS 207.26]|uniref:NAD(P)-binding protein n=1 Tax=Zopfia rhizophila CBS 207.26 TaxID=1314779 RepID=A0A6A6DFN8_9PEZI|nr:hypothetical protein K469DRAFT_677524 [Zopfia rhizophila CBS 207.26]
MVKFSIIKQSNKHFAKNDAENAQGLVCSACERIAAAEKKVDYLFMSQGGIPLTVPRYTKEGIDICSALSYFSRMWLIVNLLPLLRQSSRPRVLSVLNGGREKTIMEDDIGLEDARHYAPRAAINHTTTMTSPAFELLASSDKHITFMHAFPGLVATDNFARLAAPESYGFIGRLIVPLLGQFISMVQWLFGMSAADCGARQAFLLTSEKYGPGEAWRIDQRSDSVATSGVLEEYRERGWRDKVWDYTIHVFEKALATSS